MELEEEELHSGGIDVGQIKTPDSPCSMYYYPHFPDERMGRGAKIATAEPRMQECKSCISPHWSGYSVVTRSKA